MSTVKTNEKGEFTKNSAATAEMAASADKPQASQVEKPAKDAQPTSSEKDAQPESLAEKTQEATLESGEAQAPAPESDLKLASKAATAPKTQFLQQKAHPLQTNWQFWYYQRQVPFYTLQQQQTLDGITTLKPQPQPPAAAERGQEKETYFEQLKPLGRIPSIEHFFNYYVHMKKPTEMPREIDIFFFREPEVPMWEVGAFKYLNFHRF